MKEKLLSMFEAQKATANLPKLLGVGKWSVVAVTCDGKPTLAILSCLGVQHYFTRLALPMPSLLAFALLFGALEYEAVKAPFQFPYSNGPTEGLINRLKLLKRSMYGRGNFALLRQRMLSEVS